MSWEYVGRATANLKARVDINKHILAVFGRHGISAGALAHHIPSIILFTRRAILEEIGGFRHFGASKEDAIAAEVAFSREIAALGQRISKVSDIPFQFIGHAEWRPNGLVTGASAFRAFLRESYWRTKGELKVFLGMRRLPRRAWDYTPMPSIDEVPCC
jgi:hypothetical protein